MTHTTQINKFIQPLLATAAFFALLMSMLPVPVLAMNSDLGACEIEGHKYDQTGSPLADWQIGLMKIITQEEKTDVWDLAIDTTDSDGYFCLEWDGETRQFRGEGEQTIVDGQFSLVYRVYEKLVDGWKNISVEMGSDFNNLAVVSNIQNDGEEVSVQVGEENGYIYADAAFHVDFYNKKDETTSTATSTSTSTSTSTTPCVDTETVKCEVSEIVVENTSRHSGGSGTRVNRKAAPKPQVLGVSTSSPAVLGEQVLVVPAGAPAAGAGGTSTSNTLTLSQILFVSRRSSLYLK